MSTLCLGGPLERFRVFARAAIAAFQNDYWYIRYMYLEHFEQIRDGINLIEHLIIHVVISFWSNSRNHREWRWNRRRYEFQYFNSTVHWLSVIQDTILASKNKQTIEQGYYTNRISKIWFFKKLNWQGLACPQNIWGILHHISEIFYLKKAHSIPYRQTTGLGGTRIIASDWEEIVNPPRLTKPTYCSLPTARKATIRPDHIKLKSLPFWWIWWQMFENITWALEDTITKVLPDCIFDSQGLVKGLYTQSAL